MINRIFTLQNPVKTDIYIIKERAYAEGTIGVLNVMAKDNTIVIEGKVLIQTHIADKMCDFVSRKPKGLFNIRFSTESDVVEVKKIIGNTRSEFWLENERMSNIFFSQKGIKVSNLEDIPDPGQEFITCPIRPGLYPSAGDLYYDEPTEKIRMYMISGWTDTNITMPSTPQISARKIMEIPEYHAVFLCEPLEKRKWDRAISKGRAAKVLKASRKKHG